MTEWEVSHTLFLRNSGSEIVNFVYSLRGKNQRLTKKRATVESIPAAIRTPFAVNVPTKKANIDRRNNAA